MLAPDEEDGAIAAMRFSLATDIVELVVLTSDEIFLQTLREAVGGSRRLWHVPASDKVSDLLLAGGVGILVLDAQSLNEAAGPFIEQIKRQFPDLVVVVAGSREAEAALARAISDGTVYRFIHKPMSPGRARLFADAAVRRYSEQRMPGAAAPAVLVNHGLLIGGSCAALGVLLAGLWILRQPAHEARNFQQVPEAASPAPAAPMAAPAAEDPAANRSTAPGGDGALELYQKELANNPAEAEAPAGLADVRERLLARAESALLEERLDEAAMAIAAARKAGAQGGRVALLSAQLAKARAPVKAPQTASRGGEPDAAPPVSSTAEAAGQPSEPPDPEALALRQQREAAEERGRLLKSARERLAQDRLIEPAEDSAEYYVLRLRAIDPGDAALAPLAQDLGARLVAKARHALESQQYAAARSWLERAAAAGYASPETAATQRDLDAAVAQQSFLANVVDASQLKRLTAVQPVYPSKALQNSIEGAVELEFTVAENGEVRDISVRSATPPGVFEQAAISALSQWRYQPVLRGGAPAAQRAHVRIRFAMAR